VADSSCSLFNTVTQNFPEGTRQFLHFVVNQLLSHYSSAAFKMPQNNGPQDTVT